MKLIEKIKSSKFFAKMTSGDVFTKSMLLLLVLGVWAIFIENTVSHNSVQEVYVPYSVNAKIVNTVPVEVENLVTVEVAERRPRQQRSLEGIVNQMAESAAKANIRY